MKRLLLAGIGLLLINVAQASNWVFVSSGHGVSVYVDPARITPKGGMIQFWEKNVYESEYLNGRKFAYGITLMYANCEEQSMYQKMGTAYDENGNSIETDGPLPVQFVPVTPDSTGESELNYVCKAVKRKTHAY